MTNPPICSPKQTTRCDMTDRDRKRIENATDGWWAMSFDEADRVLPDGCSVALSCYASYSGRRPYRLVLIAVERNYGYPHPYDVYYLPAGASVARYLCRTRLIPSNQEIFAELGKRTAKGAAE